MILGIAETTVKTHLKNSRIKLETVNKTHTVVKAIRHSEIPLFNTSQGLSSDSHGEASAFDIDRSLKRQIGLPGPYRGRSQSRIAEMLEDIDELMESARTAAEFFAAMDQGCAVLGFDALMLSCHKPTREALLLDPTYCTIPLNIVREYKRRNWIENDVLLSHIIGGNQAFVWDSTYDRYRDPRGQSFLQFLKRSCLTTGILIPLEDEEGFWSFLSLHAHYQREIGSDTIDFVEVFGRKARKKVAELGL